MQHTNASVSPSGRRAVERLRRNLALAARGLRRSPGFTAAAIGILALGNGMSTAMFTIYRAVLVDRLPVGEQERLVVMHPLDRGGSHLDVLRAAGGRPPRSPGGRRGRRAVCNGSCIQVLGSRISRGLGDHRAGID